MGDGDAPPQVLFNLISPIRKKRKLTLITFSNHSGICIVYTLRVNMSVAAVKMEDDLDWSESQKGFVLVRHESSSCTHIHRFILLQTLSFSLPFTGDTLSVRFLLLDSVSCTVLSGYLVSVC